MKQVEDVLMLLASDSTNCYGPRPIPDAIDDDVRDLLRSIEDSTPETREALVSVMTERHGFVLLAFAERMASHAVRTHDTQFIRQGLQAAAIGSQSVYFKESVPALCLLYQSAVKLGCSGEILLGEVDCPESPLFETMLHAFPMRTEEDRSIESMGYIESFDHDGFRYHRTW